MLEDRETSSLLFLLLLGVVLWAFLSHLSVMKVFLSQRILYAGWDSLYLSQIAVIVVYESDSLFNGGKRRTVESEPACLDTACIGFEGKNF